MRGIRSSRPGLWTMAGNMRPLLLLLSALFQLLPGQPMSACYEGYALLQADEPKALRFWSKEPHCEEVNARAVLGVLLARAERLHEAMPHLSSALKANPADWVVASYLGAAHELLARRLASQIVEERPRQATRATASAHAVAGQVSMATADQPGSADVQRPSKYYKALEAAISLLRGAIKYRTAWLASAPSARQPLPHAVLARPDTYLYRSLGGCLQWLDRHDEARQVYRDAVAARIGWVDEWARPAEAYGLALPEPQPFFDACPHRARDRAHGEVAQSRAAHSAHSRTCRRHSCLYTSPPLVDLLDTFTRALPHVRLEFLALMTNGTGRGTAQHQQQADVAATQPSNSTTVPASFQYEQAGLHAERSWSVFLLHVDGQPRPRACEAAPYTCKLLQHPLAAVADGQAKFSVMLPGTHVKPHAGPINARLRMHCTLTTFHGGPRQATFRVGTQSRHWHTEVDDAPVSSAVDSPTPGLEPVTPPCFLFDESFEHEVTTAGEDEGARAADGQAAAGTDAGARTASGASGTDVIPAAPIHVDALGNPTRAGYRAVLLVDIVNPYLATLQDYRAAVAPGAWKDQNAGVLTKAWHDTQLHVKGVVERQGAVHESGEGGHGGDLDRGQTGGQGGSAHRQQDEL